jgi:3-hydroxybutyrate dehydrogenase
MDKKPDTDPVSCKAPLLAGRTAVVTGSTSGIGLAIAQAMAMSGMNVVLNGLEDVSLIEPVCHELQNKHSVGAVYCQANMANSAEIAGLVDVAQGTFGQVDVLVNNAGVQHVEAIEHFPCDKWDLILAVNLSAAFRTTRAVIGGMKERRWGRIINIASAHALIASPFKSAYVAAKHGLLGLTKTVALEAAEFGVTANAICPGYVFTPLVEKQIPETARARGISEAAVIKDVLLAAQPTKQFVTTDQIASLAVFLCTDEASAITGAALPVDGGWTAH